MSEEDDKDVQDESVDQDSMADEWAAAMAEQDTTEEADTNTVVEEAESIGLDEFNKPDSTTSNPDIDVILDIPVTISMQVGSTSISIRNLLQLNQGSVIELDRLAGEPLDVLVNGTLIAHGEVVVVNEKFGIRMTDVISPSERIKRLK